jgi:thiamine kinase-like enzyme
MSAALKRARELPCWQAPVAPEPLGGGITNVNFTVRDGDRRYVVRIGDDILVHQIMRFNELSASRAAHAAGLSPAVVYAEPGATVLEFVEGATLSEADVCRRPMLERIVPLVARCHRELPRHLRGPVLAFWVFHVLRDYGHTLVAAQSRMAGRLPGFLSRAGDLESAVGAVDVVFGHNDLLAANFIDDGTRLWLIDWDYAGFNSPLFDLGGLASNSGLTTDDETWLLETYFERPVSAALWRRYLAMKCASLLREAMWSMVSEIHSDLDFDYPAYTEENLGRFEAAWETFRQT